MTGHTLYYFTHSFPYGFGETWKSNELEAFRRYFERIVVVPYCYGGNAAGPQPLPVSVVLREPLFGHDDEVMSARRKLARLAGRDAGYFLRELLRERAFAGRERLRKWLAASTKIRQLRRHPTMLELMRASDERTVWFFYWGRGSCDIIPFLNERTAGRTFVRMHGYDLFEYRNDGYIPYRRPLLDSAAIVAPSSEAGVRHLKAHYPNVKARITVDRCGTVGSGRTAASDDGVLRIVSCSSLISLKRVDIIIRALGLMRIPISWTHIGGGPLLDDSRRLSASLPPNVQWTLLGHLESRQVLQYYLSRPVDLFINVSSTEGVPFSVMEAFSAGIPVFATDVGGTGEIVDETVGKLLPENVTPELLSSAIAAFHASSAAEQAQLREGAYRRYVERCDTRVLAERTARLLLDGAIPAPPSAAPSTGSLVLEHH